MSSATPATTDALELGRLLNTMAQSSIFHDLTVQLDDKTAKVLGCDECVIEYLLVQCTCKSCERKPSAFLDPSPPLSHANPHPASSIMHLADFFLHCRPGLLWPAAAHLDLDCGDMLRKFMLLVPGGRRERSMYLGDAMAQLGQAAGGTALVGGLATVCHWTCGSLRGRWLPAVVTAFEPHTGLHTVQYTGLLDGVPAQQRLVDHQVHAALSFVAQPAANGSAQGGPGPPLLPGRHVTLQPPAGYTRGLESELDTLLARLPSHGRQPPTPWPWVAAEVAWTPDSPFWLPAWADVQHHILVASSRFAFGTAPEQPPDDAGRRLEDHAWVLGLSLTTVLGALMTQLGMQPEEEFVLMRRLMGLSPTQQAQVYQRLTAECPPGPGNFTADAKARAPSCLKALLGPHAPPLPQRMHITGSTEQSPVEIGGRLVGAR